MAGDPTDENRTAPARDPSAGTMDDLRAEAIAFGRYLVDREPTAELVERYCQANAELFAHEPPDPAATYAREHPWAIAMLDAAAGLAGMRGAPSLLRKKLLVMTAILETTPEYVDRTEPTSASLPELALRLGLAGARTALNAAAGLALLAMVKRRG
jgi:hypothetical protein